jgi:glutathione S-transferase
MLPAIFNQTPGRREVKRLTGNYWVPVLVTDDGDVIQGSREIAEWAQANPPAVATAS